MTDTVPEITPNQLVQLQTGRVFLAPLLGGTGFGRDVKAMKSAWQDSKIRARVNATQEQESPGTKSWARIAFGETGDGGLVEASSDIPLALGKYRQRPDRLQWFQIPQPSAASRQSLTK